MSGKATVFTFTMNHQPFHPQVPPPYVIALVEQPDLRIPTNLVNCELDRLSCGMPVRVLFEQHGEIFVPLFEPDERPEQACPGLQPEARDGSARMRRGPTR